MYAMLYANERYWEIFMVELVLEEWVFGKHLFIEGKYEGEELFFYQAYDG
jgi:hypothetical protein